MAQTVMVPVALPAVTSLAVAVAAAPLELSRPQAVSARAVVVRVATVMAVVRLMVDLTFSGAGRWAGAVGWGWRGVCRAAGRQPHDSADHDARSGGR